MLSWMITSAGGIAVVALFDQLPPLLFINSLLLGCLLLLAFSRKMLLPAMFVSGLGWGVYYGHGVVQAQLPASFEGVELWVEGTVVGLPRTDLIRTEPSQRFGLQLDGPVCLAASTQCVGGIKRLQLRWYRQSSLRPGQRWRLMIKAKRPYGMANPGGFDYQSWLIQQGVGGTGYVKEHADNRLLAEQHWHIDRWRWQLARLVDEQAADLAHRGIFKALLLGDRRDIDRQQWALFADTGTSHLMVISGLHVGLISSLVYFIVRCLVLLLCPRCAAERWAATAAVAAALLYAVLAGFSLPTQRALVMIAVLMALVVSQRTVAPLNGLVVAAWACLLIDPLAPVSASFWLSFGAVACLFYGSVGRRDSRQQVRRWWSAQYLVFVGLLPVLAILLGRVSGLSPLANTVLVPLFSLLVIPLNLLAGILALGGGEWSLGLWGVLDRVVGIAFEWLYLLQHRGQAALLPVATPSLLVKGLAVLAVLILLLPRGMPFKAAGVILLLPLLLSPARQLQAGDLALTVLDVGQGLSVVVQTRNKVLVYDVGPAWGERFDAATAAVVPFLYSRGLDRIDQLVISHADSDHAGAWQRLPRSLAVAHVYYGEPLAELAGIERSRCQAGQQWRWDDVQFQFLSPPPGDGAREPADSSANNRSCVLLITSGKHRFLLPGDIEQSVELALLQSTSSLAAEVLVAPHHGSGSSSSWPFIKAVNPGYVVFSSGYRNQFGHPSAEVVTRYRQLGAQRLTTSVSGAISFTLRGGQLIGPDQYRLQYQHYWLRDPHR